MINQIIFSAQSLKSNQPNTNDFYFLNGSKNMNHCTLFDTCNLCQKFLS